MNNIKMVAIIPLGIGSVAGVALGLYSTSKFHSKKNQKSRIDLEFRYGMRKQFLKNFYGEVLSFVTHALCSMEIQDNSDGKYNANKQELMQNINKSYYALRGYYHPLNKLYFNDASFRKYSGKISRHIKAVHSKLNLPEADKESIMQDIRMIIEDYKNLYDKIKETEILLWI